jgi:DNA repair photolyase
MQYKHIRVDSLLNKITTKDILFAGDYTIDPYQNCEFGCKYCDSSFEKTIYIKTNASEILKKELKNLPKGRIIVGSVHDPYQKIEEKLKITRNLLKIIKEQSFTCHILTKSDLVLRDVDILSDIKDSLVTISITSIDEKISNIFEQNVPSPKNRLEIIEKLNENGIKAGLAVIPVLPFIFENNLEKIAKSAEKHNAQYLLFEHLELKGNQKNIYLGILRKFYPTLVEKYEKLYHYSYMPEQEYISKINSLIDRLYSRYDLKNKVF